MNSGILIEELEDPMSLLSGSNIGYLKVLWILSGGRFSMPQIGSVINPNNYSMFLENPSELPELDKWVEECITSQKRFTFSERDVLQSLWDGGEDIRLREDSRFCEVIVSNQTQEVQWRLNRQAITNQRLYELLEDEEWDGNNLYQCLEQLDQNISEAVLPAALENWLLQREEWVRVGRDMWFPKKLVPSLAKSHRYAVLPEVLLLTR